MELPPYRLLFLRTACHDIPAKGVSSYELEMLDVKTLLDAARADQYSLVCTDELGRGTSSREGASFALALLEHLRAPRRYHGIMATHLHEIFDLPALQPLRALRMRVAQRTRFTYQLEEGICTHSMAHAVARKQGLPATLLRRQLELEEEVSRKRKRAPVDEPAAAPRLDLARLRELSARCLRIGPREEPPASASARSYMYIAEVQLQQRYWYYVGETDNLYGRLRDHRELPERKEAVFYALHVPDKSTARRLETRIQQLLAKYGLPLLSEQDAAHQHFAACPAVDFDVEQLVQLHTC
jgi:predicted GIY-YIG superfamily endonuclease